MLSASIIVTTSSNTPVMMPIAQGKPLAVNVQLLVPAGSVVDVTIVGNASSAGVVIALALIASVEGIIGETDAVDMGIPLSVTALLSVGGVIVVEAVTPSGREVLVMALQTLVMADEIVELSKVQLSLFVTIACTVRFDVFCAHTG